MEAKHIPITVIVPTGNRLDTIEDCLKSVRWADEVLVVDSFSNDGTYELALKYADRVLRHEYGYSALQKNWAIPHAKYDWVFIVDTDERVTEDLQREILGILSKETLYQGYLIPRINFFLGKPIIQGGYYPDYQLRLFMRDHGRYDLRRVHAHIILDGKCGSLKSPIVHYAHRNIDQTAQNLLILMTSWEAEQREIISCKKTSKVSLPLWVNIIFRPVAAFFLRYFRQGGWRDGYHGLVVSLFWSMYTAITYIKIWESRLGLGKEWWKENWTEYTVKKHE